ncbi:MAG: PAS domain-containing sensor histidine kinase [Planctomycetota bacterium]
MSTVKKIKTSGHCISKSDCVEGQTLANATDSQGGMPAQGCTTSAKDFLCAVYSVVFGERGPMFFVSKEWTRWTGCSSKELLEDPEAWPKCIHPDDRARVVRTIGDACRDEVPYSLEYRVVHRDTGQVRYVRDQDLLGEDEETAIAGLDRIVTDVTELRTLANELQEYRDRLEGMVQERTAELLRANEVLRIGDAERRKVLEALAKNEEKLRTIFENVTDVICYLDNTGKILDVNSRITNVIGYRPEEVIGRNFAAIGVFDAAELPGLVKLFKDTVLSSEPVSPFELKLRHKSGATVFVEVGAQFIKGDGKVKGIVTIVKDITKRKQDEQSLKSLNEELKAVIRKLTAANGELVDFAHVAAHDLKAPLRGIGDLADMMSAEYGDKLDEHGRELLGTLLVRAGRMHSLIDSILKYSQFGRVADEKETVDLNRLLQEVIAAIAPPENVAISTSDRLPTLVCDRTRMIQIFQNLLDNAVKYMDKPRSQIRIDCAEEDGFWKFSIADNGRGIRPEHFKKIFQMFQTLSSGDDKGTGIGLAIVKKLVETSGGSIWVESQVDEGSTFFFTLPQ